MAKKHPWLKAWKENKFNITTDKPSILVKEHESELSAGDWVLDAGCGNGRNTSYLAAKGCRVDAFDVLDESWIKQIPNEVKQRINFQQTNILEHTYPQDKYAAVIATRIIQYLNTKELDFFLEKVASSLKKDGFLLLSFNNKGGIFQRDDIEVPKYKYSIEQIKEKLAEIFQTIDISKGAEKSKHVNYIDKIQSYDIYATGLIVSADKGA